MSGRTGDVAAFTLSGLSFTYRNAARPALAEVDLELPAGSRRLLIGPTGAGKSTLVRCLNRVIPRFYPGVQRGTIRLDGFDTAAATVPSLAGRVGIVFQNFESQIFSTSCLAEVAFAMENRRLPPGEIGGKASDLLARVGLAGFERRDPATLSGGEKQRLVIAAVLAQEAPLLVLDEPASDLDPGGRRDIYTLLGSLPNESVLLVEHDLEGLPFEDGGALLRQGQVTRTWSDGDAGSMIALAGLFESEGVRPPPLASLCSMLAERHGISPAVDRLEPAAFDAALVTGGWRIESPARPASSTVKAPGAPLVVCERLTHAYPDAGGRDALHQVDLTIRQGEMIALVGANGSGKTTLARHLNGLLAPTSGRVLYRGEDVRAMPATRRAGEIGFVFQDPDHQIFASTVREEAAFGPTNMGLPPELIERRVQEALEAVGLSGALSVDPFTMTKGERQRLALASVLACAPSLIIMDEPTTGLDLGQQLAVMDLLGRLNAAGHTILIITHALWLVREPVSRVLVMIEGSIAADGRPGSLMTDAGLMKKAGLRMHDLASLSARRGLCLLTVQEWVTSLVPPALRSGT